VFYERTYGHVSVDGNWCDCCRTILGGNTASGLVVRWDIERNRNIRLVSIHRPPFQGVRAVMLRVQTHKRLKSICDIALRLFVTV
jgi:hypothetical protein